jgi:aryl-alcohol dehydrogenase-like predicted oxidoreductase
VRLVVYFWRLSRRSNSRAMGKSSEKGVSIKTLALGSPCQLLNGLYFPHGGCTVRYPAERDADGTVRNFISLAHRNAASQAREHWNRRIQDCSWNYVFRLRNAEEDAFAILDAFVEAGGNLIDTANVYVGGVSEQIIGRWFAARPRDVTDRVVLASKGRFGGGPDVNAVGLSRRHLHRALNASLGRLGVETIDLYQLHASDMHTPVEETLSFLDEAVKAGKIHYIGLSNFTGWQLQLIISTAKAMGVQVPVTLQPQYSLLSREIEWEIIPAALHNGIGLLPWSPLAGGFLTGKYQRGGAASLRHASGFREANLSMDFGRICQLRSQLGDDREVVRIAKEIGATPAQVALSWIADRPGVIAPIVGARTVEHLRNNLGAADLTLITRQPKLLKRSVRRSPAAIRMEPLARASADARYRMGRQLPHQPYTVGSAHPTGLDQMRSIRRDIFRLPDLVFAYAGFCGNHGISVNSFTKRRYSGNLSTFGRPSGTRSPRSRKRKTTAGASSAR